MEGWRTFSIVGCIFFTQVLDVASAGGGSDVIIGIVFACVGILLIVIGIVVCMLCRGRKRALKNTNPRAPNPGATDEGHALPADIPIEAINRIPPPLYSHPHQHPPRTSTHRTSSGRPSRNGDRDLPPPPPYSPPPGDVAAADVSSHEAPPEYRSRVRLNSITTSGVEPRQRNPPSTVQYPSMRNILLTSSRSTLPGTDQRRASQSDRPGPGAGIRGGEVSMSPSGRAGRPPGGDGGTNYGSVDATSRGIDDVSGLRQTHRSISTSSSALYDPGVSVPEAELQRKVRRSKEMQTRNVALNRSCPSLTSVTGEEAPGPTTSGGNTTSRNPGDHHHHHHRRRSAADGESASKSESTQQRSRRRRDDAKVHRLYSSTEFSDDQLQEFRGNRGYSTDSDASGIPTGPSSRPIMRFERFGTYEV